MSSRPWVPYVAAGCALSIFAGASGGTAFVMPAIFISGVLFAIAAFVGFRGRRDRYDLTLLREVHEKQIAREIELDEPEEYDSVLCMCGIAYTSDLPVCPQCGRRNALGC